MRTLTKATLALSTAFLIGLAGASPSFAKAHDQGLAKGTENNKNADKAGRFGGSTAEAAQNVGAARGGRNSENAGMKGENGGSQPSPDRARSAAD
jgi:hypothetical protein